MIFEVRPAQIERLDSKELVELLKKLLHAEAQCSGINLSGVSVPLQITVADGGEDGRIEWEGGLESTDYLPSRFCIFQAKATKLSKAGWKKEVWRKGTQGKGQIRELNDAVRNVLEQGGAYIGFTRDNINGLGKSERIQGIKEGIKEAGGELKKLNMIDIYGADEIAKWVSKYPAIAVWLNEKQSGLNLKGFQTIGMLGERSDIKSISNVEDKANRFLIGGKSNLSQPENRSSDDNSLAFEKVKERITTFLAEPGKAIRVIGPSGVGKTRSVFEIFKDEASINKACLATSAMYCDLRDVGNTEIFQISQSIVGTLSSTLMIIDECPRDVAIKLCELVAQENSGLSVITIGNDNEPIEAANCLNIRVNPADDNLVEGIIRQRYSKADYSDIGFIKNLSAGYPRIAVLITDNYSEGMPILKSIEDVVMRILRGCGIERPEQIRALECLALFRQLGSDGQASQELDFVAENLARLTGDEMYEHLAYASKHHHFVDHQGYCFVAQPLPIAAFLGSRRLDLLRVNTVLNFIEKAPSGLRQSFLDQWHHFDKSQTAMRVSQHLLGRDGWCGSLEGINTEIGAQCLKALVHIDPDSVADVIRRTFKEYSVDELDSVLHKKRELIQVLRLLAFRKKSFYISALILMKLGVISNNLHNSHEVANQFKQFYYLRLSSTEAEPAERFAVLDQGLSSDDGRIVLLCIQALGNTLERRHFSRWGGSDLIGSQTPLKDWHPEVLGEVFNFHKEGLKRLRTIHKKHNRFSTECERFIAKSIRALICENLFDSIAETVLEITHEKGFWLEAIKGVGDWLYFDRKDSSSDFSQKIRKFYNCLIPTDLVQQALLYTKFWPSDIHNPDLICHMDDKDFDYSSRKAKEVAAQIGRDKKMTYQVIKVMIGEELKDPFPFTQELAANLENPVDVFKFAVDQFKSSSDGKGIQFFYGLLSGIDQVNHSSADLCIDHLTQSDIFKGQMVNIYTAVKITSERLSELVQLLKKGTISAASCIHFSYGSRLNALEPREIYPLIDELFTNCGNEGLWAALEIISMYKHNQKNNDNGLWLRMKLIIASKDLIGTVRDNTRDAYVLEDVVRSIHENRGIDDEFAIGLSKQIVVLCQVNDYGIFSHLDAVFYRIIEFILKDKPIILWRTLSSFFEIATPQEIHYLECLVGFAQFDAYELTCGGGGLMYADHLESEYLKWVRKNPDNRVPFLCSFYPLLEKNFGDDHYHWHSATQAIASEFGAISEFRDALSKCLCPSSYSGSIIPYFEKFLAPLKSWFQHPTVELSVWSREKYRVLEREIERQRQWEDGN